MNSNEQTGITNLIAKYNNKIELCKQQIDFNQKQIETDRATIGRYQEKIIQLKEIAADLKELSTEQKNKCTNKGDQKWAGLNQLTNEKLKFLTTSDINLNRCTSEIKPLTTNQIAEFAANAFEEISLEDILKRLTAANSFESYIKPPVTKSNSRVDITYSSDALWPLEY